MTETYEIIVRQPNEQDEQTAIANAMYEISTAIEENVTLKNVLEVELSNNEDGFEISFYIECERVFGGAEKDLYTSLGKEEVVKTFEKANKSSFN